MGTITTTTTNLHNVTGGNTKLLAANWEKLTLEKNFLVIITNELKLNLKEIPKNKQH